MYIAIGRTKGGADDNLPTWRNIYPLRNANSENTSWLIYPIGSSTRLENDAKGNRMKRKLACTKCLETKVSMHEVSGDERVIRRTRQMKGGETVRELRLSIWIISIILFVHFSLVNTFLPIICRLTQSVSGFRFP